MRKKKLQNRIKYLEEKIKNGNAKTKRLEEGSRDIARMTEAIIISVIISANESRQATIEMPQVDSILSQYKLNVLKEGKTLHMSVEERRNV